MPRRRLHTIFGLALPIMGAMVSQNVLNLVDLAMVGTLGEPALAAVGVGSFATLMALTLVAGLASGGVQAMAARRQGEGREQENALPLNAGLLLALGIGAPACVVLVQLAPHLFPYLTTDPAVQDQGVPYVQARLFAAVFVATNYSFRGYWNGVHRSRLYLRTLVIMHAANIGLDWVLIFGKLGAPALGTLGAGMASSLATALGTAHYVALGMRHARSNGFLRRLPDRATLRTLLRLGIPVGLQQFFFLLGFTALLWIVGRVGTRELAAATVLTNVTLLAILPGLGLGLAAATLVGQALGRDARADARRWGWDVGKIGAACTIPFALLMLLAPELVLRIFLHEPEALAVARIPLQLVGAILALDVLGLVLLNALVGAGDTRRVFVVSTTLQWGLALPAAWLAGPVLGYGLLGIWIAIGAWRLLQAGVYAVLWQRGGWAAIRV